MATLLLSHPACFEHDTGLGHPERSARLKAVMEALAADEFSELIRREAPRAEVEQLARVHPMAYVERTLKAIPELDHFMLDSDTIVSPGSGEAALRAAGSVVAAVDAVMGGEVGNAFCAVRPPGHHAEPSRSMGFCLFNNVAVGAAHAHVAHGLKRIAIIDFDVHHGNGTQAMAWDEPWMFYASTHESPLYPGTGFRRERGSHFNVFNVPLPPGTKSSQFRHAIEALIIPELEVYRPELVMISAGFDAHSGDPLATLDLEDEDYAWVTRQLCQLAHGLCHGRVVSVLEGGYDLKSLADATVLHVRELMRAA